MKRQQPGENFVSRLSGKFSKGILVDLYHGVASGPPPSTGPLELVLAPLLRVHLTRENGRWYTLSQVDIGDK